MPASPPAPPAAAGCILIDGNASARCGISMKGVDIVVKGSVGHMSAFMAQAGALVVLGDAGEALGDSLYEAKLFVRGTVASLGADCIEKEMREEHRALLAGKLEAAGMLGQGRYRRVPPLRLGPHALPFPRRQRVELPDAAGSHSGPRASGRACPGHPRLFKGAPIVDARDSPGMTGTDR